MLFSINSSYLLWSRKFLTLGTSSFTKNPVLWLSWSLYTLVTKKTYPKTYVSPSITLFDCRTARPVTILMRSTQWSRTPQVLCYSTKIIVTAQSHLLPAIAASEWKGLLSLSKVNMKVKNDHRSKFSNLSNWKEEAWKKKITFIYNRSSKWIISLFHIKGKYDVVRNWKISKKMVFCCGAFWKLC